MSNQGQLSSIGIEISNESIEGEDEFDMTTAPASQQVGVTLAWLCSDPDLQGYGLRNFLNKNSICSLAVFDKHLKPLLDELEEQLVYIVEDIQTQELHDDAEREAQAMYDEIIGDMDDDLIEDEDYE